MTRTRRPWEARAARPAGLLQEAGSYPLRGLPGVGGGGQVLEPSAVSAPLCAPQPHLLGGGVPPSGGIPDKGAYMAALGPALLSSGFFRVCVTEMAHRDLNFRL